MTKQLKEIEIPFGAKDSELCDWEYTIPEGMEATIVDNKIVVKKKDSGDERIRKALLNEFIHLQSKGYKFAGLEGEEIVAWIEKQGEQKPADKVAPKFKVGDTVRFKGNETLKGEAETHKIVGYDNELYVFADGTTDLFCEQELYELVEQKSIAWSEEDEDMLQSILDEYKSMTTEKRNWLKSIKDIVQPQTKQEWSEEDEKRVESLHGWLDTLVNYIHHDAIVSLDLRRERMQQVERLKTWLKFLIDRVQPQPKQEWSEEDKEIINNIGEYLNRYGNYILESNEEKAVDVYKSADWLKFLIERYNWKPSDVQMRILFKYAEQNNYDGSVLTSLYQELKKLKE